MIITQAREMLRARPLKLENARRNHLRYSRLCLPLARLRRVNVPDTLVGHRPRALLLDHNVFDSSKFTCRFTCSLWQFCTKNLPTLLSS